MMFRTIKIPVTVEFLKKTFLNTAHGTFVNEENVLLILLL